jgi:hypothetical protein
MDGTYRLIWINAQIDERRHDAANERLAALAHARELRPKPRTDVRRRSLRAWLGAALARDHGRPASA